MVWVVVGVTGEYEDLVQWNVGAFHNEANAHSFCNASKDWRAEWNDLYL